MGGGGTIHWHGHVCTQNHHDARKTVNLSQVLQSKVRHYMYIIIVHARKSYSATLWCMQCSNVIDKHCISTDAWRMAHGELHTKVIFVF